MPTTIPEHQAQNSGSDRATQAVKTNPPRDQTISEVILDRQRAMLDELRSIHCRIAERADRITGTVPESVDEAKPDVGTDQSFAHQTDELLDRQTGVLECIRADLVRLELFA